MSCLTICNAQKLLPINRNGGFEPTGALDIEFTDSYNIIYLSRIVDWDDGDSYTIKFREPIQSSNIHIGQDVVPKGAISFQGYNPTHGIVEWMAANGEYFEASYAYISVLSDIPTKLSISELTINRKDGSSILCYYPNFSRNRQFESKHIHWEASNGEEFERFIEFSARLYKVNSFSGKVPFDSNSSLGGTEWANTTSNKSTYRLKLYNPTSSDNFAWKYVTKSGDTRYQKIEKNTTMSTLSVDETVTECYIVPLGFNENSPTEYLEIQEVSLIDGSQPKFETLVLWHANGKTTEISLSKKPRVTFSADKVLVKGSGINFEYSANDIIKFTYKKEDVVNDIDAPNNEVNFFRDEEHIVFNGIKSTDEVALYKLNGSRIPVQLIHSDDNKVTLSLSGIPSGIYILKVNGKTTKITKQ